MKHFSESRLRIRVARRITAAGDSFVRAGLLSQDRFRAHVHLQGTIELSVQQCRWIRYERLSGEIDIVVPALGIAVECKSGRNRRTNWEEALGQALRDLEIPWIQHAYIALPHDDVDPWMMKTVATNNVGVISLGSGLLPVRFLCHPLTQRSPL